MDIKKITVILEFSLRDGCCYITRFNNKQSNCELHRFDCNRLRDDYITHYFKITSLPEFLIKLKRSDITPTMLVCDCIISTVMPQIS